VAARVYLNRSASETTQQPSKRAVLFCKPHSVIMPGNSSEPIQLDEYTGLFSGQRIGGMPTVKLNIIAEELNALERGSRPLPASRLAPGPRLKSPKTRARKDAADMRATQQRPGTSLGLVGRLHRTVSKEAAFQRSGLDPDATRERLFGTEHNAPKPDRFATTYNKEFKFFKGADEISLYSTLRKTKSKPEEAPRRSQSSLGMKHVATKRNPSKLQIKRAKLDPFLECPKWETTTSGGFNSIAGWNSREGVFRRSKPWAQRTNPLIPSDI